MVLDPPFKEYKATGDRPFNNCKTFLPEQSSTRLSTNMPIVLRTPFGTLQSQSRTSYDTLRKMNSIRNRAAITIQAHWRGYATRQRLRRHASRNQPQAASGGHKAQKNPSSEHKSTTLNQPNYRSYQNRDDLRAQDLRAAQIQKEWREFLHRQQTEKNKSLVSIQTHYKDPKSATELFLKIRAATIIQSWFRGFKARKALKEKKQASSLRLGRSSNRFSFRRPSSNSLRKSSSQPMASSSRSGLKTSTVPVKSEASWMSADLKSDKGRNLPQKQHSVSKNSEGLPQNSVRLGQSSFSCENPNSNWTEDVEKEDGCCKNIFVAQSMEMQPRFKFEAMENRTYPKPGTNSKPLVPCRPSIPIMTFSTQYHCRNTITPGNSSLVSQDRSRERVKSSCDNPWSEKSKVILPYRSDHRPSGHAYGPEPFRKRQARNYPNNQLSSTLFERRKSLYEGKMIEPYKCPQNNPPVQVPGPSFGWRKMSYGHSSEPQFQQCFKGKDRTFCDRQNDQENISPSREEHQGSVSLYNTDMCSIKSARDSVLGPTCCQPIEKTMPSYDNRSNVNTPPTFPSNSDNCMRKVTCDKCTDMPLYRQRELNASLMDNELEEQDHRFPSRTVNTSPEYICNSIKTKADFGKFHEQSQGRMHEWAQNNNHNSQDAQSQPACGPAGLSHRKCSQQLFHRSFTEGINGPNIQCAWKGIQSRVALKRQNDAATRIQACFRGYMVRKYLQSSGILNRNHDEEAMRKEPKAAGDNQRFSIPSRLSPKRDNSSHHLQNYESHFHSSRQSFRALQGTVEKEVPSIRYSRSSFA